MAGKPSARDLKRAMAIERERCARIADRYERAEREPPYKILPRAIAAAIRGAGGADGR